MCNGFTRHKAACVIDQHINTIAKGGLRRGHQGINTLLRVQIRLHRDGAATCGLFYRAGLRHVIVGVRAKQTRITSPDIDI